jgi:RNA polymerase sigma-B factor
MTIDTIDPAHPSDLSQAHDRAAESGAATEASRSTSQPASRTERARRTAELLRAAYQTTDEQRRHALLDDVVVLNMGVADALARRYRARGIALDDLEQVAYLALVKAARGYDDAAGHDFLSYAVPTIRGELKRHFRDQGWTIRPTRRIQELQARINSAESDLCFSLGRSPRPSEIAAHLGESIEDVREALSTDGCFSPTSLDQPASTETDTTIGDLIGNEDAERNAVEARVILAPVVRRLGERDRRILMLRFMRGWTQQEIATDIGVTQMQVSRLLSRILGELRTELEGRDIEPAMLHSA